MITDARPANCRFRLQDEDKTYPKSTCGFCKKSISTGLGNECHMDMRPVIKSDPTPTLAYATTKELVNAPRDCPHDIAVAEQFRNDPELPLEMLRQIFAEGDQGELAITLRQIQLAFGKKEI